MVLGHKHAKKILVLGISYVPQIDFNSIMRYYRGDIFIIIMLQIENYGNFLLKILGILQSPTVFSIIDVFVLQVVSTVL